ncbi:MAG: hypothetical protein EOM44_12930 [Bacteroidia bacterium]|nr:hypothetical protein [Bacteroidia bacterium]
MNNELKQVKINLRKIEKFCKSRPLPSVRDVDFFIQSEKLDEYKEFATATITSVHAAEWLLHQKKINKYRS